MNGGRFERVDPSRRKSKGEDIGVPEHEPQTHGSASRLFQIAFGLPRYGAVDGVAKDGRAIVEREAGQRFAGGKPRKWLSPVLMKSSPWPD